MASVVKKWKRRGPDEEMLSVGLEDPDDIIEDLRQALDLVRA